MPRGENIILYVDDDADDREFLSETITDANPSVKVVVAQNGLEAINYLESRTENKNNLPSLVILDLNMPVLNGRETLLILKSESNTREIPVVVFTSSRSPADEAFCKRFGVDMFTKPHSHKELQNISGKLLSYMG